MPERDRRLAELDHAFDRSLAAGEYEAALATFREADALARVIFRKVDPASWTHFVVPVFEGLGQPDSVIARYETWLGRRQLFDNVKNDSEALPIALERLGQLYDEKGDDEKAALYYARFVELWEDADPDLQPRVRAARERLEEIVQARG